MKTQKSKTDISQFMELPGKKMLLAVLFVCLPRILDILYLLLQQ